LERLSPYAKDTCVCPTGRDERPVPEGSTAPAARYLIYNHVMQMVSDKTPINGFKFLVF